MTKEDKQLKDKAIDIKGKKYVLVSDRINYFNEHYPNGSINTELISDPNSEMVIVKSTVIPDVDKPTRQFSDYSQAVIGEGMVNKVAALENASTSATGRALAYMGIGVIDSVASVDEMHKATTNNMKFATEKQIKWIRDTARALNDQLGDDKEVDDWVEEILTVKPKQVPIYKVKDAVDKLKKEAGGKELPDFEAGEGLDEIAPVTDEILEDFKKGNLPY